MLGIVSGYDLLALESTPGRLDDSVGFFPPIGRFTLLRPKPRIPKTKTVLLK